MDETQPLLGHFVEQQSIVINRSQVDFDPDGDPDNPLEWSRAYKLEVVSLLVIMAFTVTFTCSGVVPVANRIVFDLQGEESKSAGILLVTVWELGEAAGPLLIAPLSEIYGRYPVFNVANIVFIIGVLLAAVSHTTSLFIFARFLTGFAVASNVLNPAIIGDIFSSELRGSGMSLVMFAPVVGGAIGPAVCGAIAESLGWRMVLWISATVAIICEILFYFLLRETYKVSILQRRAARLRKETNDGSFKCTCDGESGATRISWLALRTAITRPVVVMLSSTVLQIISLYGGIVFSLYYVLATTLPAILGNIYGFSPTFVGSSFLSFSVGAAGAVVVCNVFLDAIYVRLGESKGRSSCPEDRLPLSIGAATFLPLFVAMYGWISYAQWPVWLLLLCIALLGFGLILVLVPLSSYTVDSFGLYSASAMTIVLIARCLGGTLLPLTIPLLTNWLGLGYGFLVLAGVCFLLIPLPVVVMRYGSSWRQRSEYTRNN